MIFAIIAGSASGKSTVESELTKRFRIPHIISYTTRAPRKGEQNGVDYHYITEQEFNLRGEKGFFIERAVYRGCQYGLSLEGLNYKEKPYVVVVNPHGYEELLKCVGKQHITSIFLNVEERERLIRLAKRGDDIDEVIKRIHNDRKEFAEFIDTADIVYSPKEGATVKVITKAFYRIICEKSGLKWWHRFIPKRLFYRF